MQVTLVPKEHILALWPKVRPHAVKASEYTYGRFEPEDFLEAACTGQFDMWVPFDEDGVHGVVLTQFVQYPRKRCLDMTFIGGDEGMSWKDIMLDTMQRWARDNNCDSIESSGRAGWAKIFKSDGYKMLWQVYELPVEPTGVGA